MALRLKRGTAADLAAYTPLEGELIYVTDQAALYVGDGSSTLGGKLLTSGSEILEDLDLNGQDIVGTGNININGNIHASGSITADGSLTLGDANTDNVTFAADIASSLVPDNDNTFNLGTGVKRWGVIYSNVIEATQVNANTTGFHEGDVQGSVFSDNSVQLLDGINAKVVGPVETTTVAASSGITGDLVGNVTGNVTGNVSGNVAGAVTGEFTGLLKSSAGVVVGDTGSGTGGGFIGNFYGDLQGSVYPDDSSIGGQALIDGTEGTFYLNETINSHAVAKTNNTWDLGTDQKRWRRLYVNDYIQFGGDPYSPLGLAQTIKVVNDKIAVKNVITSRVPVSSTLDGAIPGPASRSTISLNDIRGIRSGAIFSLPGVTEREVASVTPGIGNKGTVTTVTQFEVTAGSTSDGDGITFFNPPENSSIYKYAAPASSLGQKGDIKGMVYADSTYLYVCREVWDGTTNIWIRMTHGSSAW